jgi:hypothetical protein
MTYAPTSPPALPNTLGDIISKVRRITKSPSQNMITDEQIVQYINTYFLYDFPQELRLKNMLSNYNFATIPNQETYPIPTDSIITIEPPVYINGYQSFFTQSQDQFYMLYPRLGLSENNLIAGNGTTGPYTFTLTNQPVLQRNVVVSVVDSTGNTATATDTPITTQIGNLTGQTIAAGSTINYITGVVTINFVNIIPAGNEFQVQVVPYQPSRPVAILFYNDTVYLRPIPDSSYLVNIQAYVNPIACILGQQYNPPTLGGTNDPTPPSPPNAYTIPPTPNLPNIPMGFVTNTDTPQIKQWWQLIAWGTSIKILEDRGDWENLALIMPQYDNQKRLVLRRTLVEMANERTATIYTEQVQFPIGNFFNQF